MRQVVGMYVLCRGGVNPSPINTKNGEGVLTAGRRLVDKRWVENGAKRGFLTFFIFLLTSQIPYTILYIENGAVRVASGCNRKI